MPMSIFTPLEPTVVFEGLAPVASAVQQTNPMALLELCSLDKLLLLLL